METIMPKCYAVKSVACLVVGVVCIETHDIKEPYIGCISI